MDMATICGKEMRKSGKLDDLEVSDEINALASVYIDDVDGKWKNGFLCLRTKLITTLQKLFFIWRSFYLS